MTEYGNVLGTPIVDEEKKRQLINNFIQNDIVDTSTEKLKAFSNLPILKEVLFLVFYKNLTHVANLHGWCGNVYAIEAMLPLSRYFPEITTRMEWKNRVRLAVSLIEMLKEFERAQLGPLHHCDVKENDFGFTKDFKVKPIDYDMIFTKDRMREILTGANCTKDENCVFWDCRSSCNVTTKRCSDRKLNTSFQVNFVNMYYSSCNTVKSHL